MLAVSSLMFGIVLCDHRTEWVVLLFTMGTAALSVHIFTAVLP